MRLNPVFGALREKTDVSGNDAKAGLGVVESVGVQTETSKE